MIIDQLPLLSGDVESTDEIPIERGTTTYKTTQAALVKSAADAASAAQLSADNAQTAADNAQTAADNAQTAADNAQTAADNVANSLATYVRPNLLENWYFVGGGSQLGYGVFPLNSKGQTVYNGYNNPFIDKWRCGAGATIGSGYVTLNHGDWVIQNISAPLTAYDGKTLTASILLADGTLLSGAGIPSSGAANYVSTSNIKLYSGNDNGLAFIIRINDTDINVVALKLEIGSTQTLAHQEGGAWVLNEVPRYGEEYAETVVSRAVATNGLIKAVTYSVPASVFGSFAQGELKQVSYTFPTAVPGTVINACMYGQGGWQVVIQVDNLSATGVVFHCANVGAAFTFDSGRELTVFYY